MLDTPASEIQDRLDDLNAQCFPCCCSFFLKGLRKEAKFLSRVLEHYEQTKSRGNQVKDSINFILDDSDVNSAAFTQETRQLITSITGKSINGQEADSLVKNKRYWAHE
ncbi:MAG TPA: hypothetical protein VGV92_08925 [Gammaproteobacteria bacterium]|nr:hypothetical protein [Gammaproteobacteria bacterium]